MNKKTLLVAAISILGGANVASAQHPSQYQPDYGMNPNQLQYDPRDQQQYQPQQHQMTGAAPQIQMQRGRTFTYALPAGWRGDDGQNSVTIVSPAGDAFGFTVGLTGMMQQMSPADFMVHALRMCNINDVQIIGGREIQPNPGCASAAEFEIAFTLNGNPWRGWARANVALAYQMCSGSMTFAGSAVNQWDQYKSWLPQVAMQTVATGANAYDRAEVAQANLEGSRAMGRQLADYNEWSRQTANGVNAARQASFDYQREGMGQMMTNNQWMNDPYGGQPQQQSMTPAVHCINPQGQVVTSADPSFDPRTASDPNWQKMTPQGR